MTRLPRVLNNHMIETRRLHVIDQSIDDRLTPLSTASLTLPQNESIAVREWIELYTESGSAGIYRVVSVSETYSNESSVELEHGACALGDAIIPGKGTLEGTLSNVLNTMLRHQVVTSGDTPLWALGRVETDTATSFEYDNSNLLSSIIAMVPDGYEMTFDQSVLPWKIGIAAMETTPGCEGRITRNLRSVTITTDDEELCTRIYCDKLPEPGYIDGPTISAWGIKISTVTAQDNVTPESLKDYIVRYLEDHKNPKVSIEIDAYDFSIATGESIDHFEKGKLFRLAIPGYGLTLEERILAVRTSSVYGDPSHVRLTLSNNIRDTADNLVYIENAINGGASSSSARGGYVGSKGTGLSQTSVLSMLKKTETYISADEAWTREAGVKIESNAAGLYATKKAIVGNWAEDVESINALIQASSDNGGIVSMIVGRKNKLEEVNAMISATAAGGGLVVLKANQKDLESVEDRVSGAEIELDAKEQRITALAGTLDAQGTLIDGVQLDLDGAKAQIELKVSKDGVISSINQTPEAVTINANRINLQGYVTASQLSAETARVDAFFNGVSIINTINATRASIGTLQVGSYILGWQKTTVVNSFTQASGETQNGDGIVLGIAAPAVNAKSYTPKAGETITF